MSGVYVIPSRSFVEPYDRTGPPTYTSFVAESSGMPTRDIMSRLRPILHPGGRRKSGYAGLPAVRLESGELALDADEVRDRWVRYFAGNEGGTRQSTTDAVELYCGRRVDARADFDILPGELPSRCCLERALLAAASGKAMGPDHIPPEALRFGSGAISLGLYQLLLKFTMRLDEPLIMKGGTICYSWKGKASPDTCSSYRALLISSVVGKAMHRVVRTRCALPMAKAATPLQVGGRPRHPVTLASHSVRLFQSWQRSHTHFILFLDLREAFYRVCRAFFQSEQPTAEELAAVFQRLDLPPTSYHEFCAAVCGENVLDAAVPVSGYVLFCRRP